MFAVSLWQPWASLMAGGAKKVETRSWRWPKELPAIVAIHAAKTWNDVVSPKPSAIDRYASTKIGIATR